MRLLGGRTRSKRQVVAQCRTTCERSLRRSIARRVLAAGLIGLVYGVCTGVILAAYHQFGDQSLLHRSPLVAADPRPLKSAPRQRALDGGTMARAPAGQGPPADDLADAAQAAPPTGQIRPAMARRSDPVPARDIDPSAALGPGDSEAPGGADADRLAEDRMAEQRSAAAAPEPRPETVAAALPGDRAGAPGASPEPSRVHVAPALPPRPAFKPRAAMPTVLAEAVPAPAALGAPEPSRNPARGIRPSQRSVKPLPSSQEMPSRPARAEAPRPLGPNGQGLPEALRAFWTNLRILLASAPASSGVRAGRDDRNGNNGATAGSGSGGRISGASGSTSAVGGNSSRDDGARSAGVGRSSTSGSRTGGNGDTTTASSGGDGGSAGRGGNGGRGRGDGDRDDGDRGGRDDGDRGDRDGGDRGGRGGDRGGDDDDDDD